MTAQRIRRWPGIETASRDCPGFADCRISMRMTLYPPVARKVTTQITRYIGAMLM